MNSIPLIKGNTPQEMNTSIIALKKALSELETQDRLLQGTDKDVQDKIKQINELIKGINTHLGTVDTHLTAIDGQITALQPVDTVTSGNMHSVTSNAVFNAINVCLPIVPTSSFAYIIKKNTIARYIGSAGKTVVVIFAIYRFTSSFTVQISCGASDPIIQQMSGEGREGFQTITQNSTPIASSEFYHYYRVSFQISSNSNYVGIGTDADIGISDYHYE